MARFTLNYYLGLYLNQIFHAWLALLTYSLTLKMEELQSSETSQNLYQTRRHLIPQKTVFKLLDAKRQPYFTASYVHNLKPLNSLLCTWYNTTSFSFMKEHEVLFMGPLRHADKVETEYNILAAADTTVPARIACHLTHMWNVTNIKSKWELPFIVVVVVVVVVVDV
jgi:hypothetical protein